MAFMIINNIITRCDPRVYDSNYERISRLRVEVTTVYPMWISSHSTLTLICSQAHLRVVICHYNEMLRMILFSIRYIIICFSKIILLRQEMSSYKAPRQMKGSQTMNYNIVFINVCICVQPASHQRRESTAINTTHGKKLII